MPGPVIIGNDDADFFSVTYFDQGDLARRSALEAQWKRFNRNDPVTGKAYAIWVRPTSRMMQVAVDHRLPPHMPAGRYRIEIFVPAKFATARKALFNIANRFTGEQHDDTLVMVDMYDLYDVWHELGEYYLEPGCYPLSGRVRQWDLSLEEPPGMVAFCPVRWTPLDLPEGAACFDSPVGTRDERLGPFASGAVLYRKYPVWDGQWFDVNPYLSWYSYGYHTGADLNLPGASGADKGKPVYAVGDGLVTYAGRAGTWGNIVVIEHPDALAPLPDGRVERRKVYSRYGHLEDRLLVRHGQGIGRGSQLGSIGLAPGAESGWHLHFDVCYTDLLKTRPAHWPNLSTVRSLQEYKADPDSRQYQSAVAAVKREVINNYLDPLRFIKANHMPSSPQ